MAGKVGRKWGIRTPVEPLRIRWYKMRQRCLDQNCVSFPDYGGRGIKICERWNSYELFKEDMEVGFSPELSLDRIDNEKGYYKENCRWADDVTQNNNTRQNNFIEFNGLSKTIPQWARMLGINKNTLKKRHYTLKWSVEKTLSTF